MPTAAAPATPDDAPPMGEELAGTSLLDWLAQFSGPHALLELAIIVVVLACIWALLGGLRKALDYRNPDSVLFGSRVYDGVLLPLLGAGVLLVVQPLLARTQPMLLLPLAIPILTSLLLIRLGVKVLRLAFPGRRWVEPISRSISWLVWACVALWIIGLGPTILHELDTLQWTIGGNRVSLRRLLESTLTAGTFLLVSLWVSSAIENRLMASTMGARLPVRKAIATTVRAVLMLIGLLVALNMAGIDLTALSVFGGALGVGIGLGLQRLAANYVSGFVLLTERVLRVGDVVRVGGFEGTITEMSGRYTAILASNGREAIVPHELLTNSMVEKLSNAQARAVQSIALTVAHGNDVALVRRLMTEAARACPRVLSDPAPNTVLVDIATDGLAFKLNYSIAGLSGAESLRSDINLAILSAFDAHGVAVVAPSSPVPWDELAAWLAQTPKQEAPRGADAGGPRADA